MLSDKAKEARNEYHRELKKSLSPEAIEKKKQYQREWRRQNPDKVREYQEAFWEQKAIKNVLNTYAVGEHLKENSNSTEGPKSITDSVLKSRIKQYGIEKVIIELRDMGLSLRAIANTLKLSHMKVKRILDEIKDKL